MRNGFEWRYIAGGLGLGIAVGVLTGVLLAWGLLFTSERDLSVITLIVAAVWATFAGAVFGLVPGALGGIVLGLVLSILVGRQPRQGPAVLVTAATCLLLVPFLAAGGLLAMRWSPAGTDDPWFWAATALPSVLALGSMCWLASHLARRNAAPPPPPGSTRPALPPGGDARLNGDE